MTCTRNCRVVADCDGSCKQTTAHNVSNDQEQSTSDTLPEISTNGKTGNNRKSNAKNHTQVYDKSENNTEW